MDTSGRWGQRQMNRRTEQSIIEFIHRNDAMHSIREEKIDFHYSMRREWGFFLSDFHLHSLKNAAFLVWNLVEMYLFKYLWIEKKNDRLGLVFISLWTLAILVCFRSLEVNVFSFGPAKNAEAQAHIPTSKLNHADGNKKPIRFVARNGYNWNVKQKGRALHNCTQMAYAGG